MCFWLNLIVSMVDYAGDGLDWLGDCHGSIFFRMHHCSVCSNLYGDSSKWFWTVYVMFLQECVPRSCVGGMRWDSFSSITQRGWINSLERCFVSYSPANEYRSLGGTSQELALSFFMTSKALEWHRTCYLGDEHRERVEKCKRWPFSCQEYCSGRNKNVSF